MIVLIFGPPGSGKGTQSTLLVEAYNLQLVSIGDLLRGIISSTSELGGKIKGAVDSGKLIHDDIVCELLHQQLVLLSNSNILLDGFPRNLNQALFLSKILIKRYGKDVDFVIELRIGDDIAIRRLKNRYICAECKSIYNMSLFKGDSCVKCKSKRLDRRTDDNDVLIIKERMNEYHFQMKNLREYYKGRLLLIDAACDINEVSQEIMDKMSCNLV